MRSFQVGLKLLREDGRVFACHSAMADTIYHAEVCTRVSCFCARLSWYSLTCAWIPSQNQGKACTCGSDPQKPACEMYLLWGMHQVGASAVILGANYTLDSLMLKYQGVDWADHDNWNCNAGCNILTVRQDITPTWACRSCASAQRKSRRQIVWRLCIAALV